jgi:hypothetical protein
MAVHMDETTAEPPGNQRHPCSNPPGGRWCGGLVHVHKSSEHERPQRPENYGDRPVDLRNCSSYERHDRPTGPRKRPARPAGGPPPRRSLLRERLGCPTSPHGRVSRPAGGQAHRKPAAHNAPEPERTALSSSGSARTHPSRTQRPRRDGPVHRDRNGDPPQREAASSNGSARTDRSSTQRRRPRPPEPSDARRNERPPRPLDPQERTARPPGAAAPYQTSAWRWS